MTEKTKNKPADVAVREYMQGPARGGTNDLHLHWLPDKRAPHGALAFTDGIQFVANRCGAWWLIDAVASHQPGVRRQAAHFGANYHSFQVWQLEYTPTRSIHAWQLTCWDDTPGVSDAGQRSNLFASQDIEYSDFPKGLSPFLFYVEHGVMLLREER